MRATVGLLSRTVCGVSIALSTMLVGSIGVDAAPDPADETAPSDPTTIPSEPSTSAATSSVAPTTEPPAPTTTEAPAPTTTSFDPYARGAEIDDLAPGARPGTTFQTRPVPPPPTTTTTTLPPPPPPPPPWALPGNSGTGRRVVYSKSLQRVWATDWSNRVIKTHRVSGKMKWCDPRPGWYSVFSRSRHTYAIQNPTIKWGFMVRFTKGCNGGNIGFHEIPFQYGRPVQSIAQLGQPLSGGCVRQARGDAIWMWNWAGIGTRVVVLP
ncbi:L,D-transpeptidase [Ilumatobacter sp.]|uniref:L,D-transpeptidase n=1 Tax=Ilumatobacter sp. TaxID=1967498 RepID=UPI003B52E7F8